MSFRPDDRLTLNTSFSTYFQSEYDSFPNCEIYRPAGVGLALATNVLSALTGSASGGMSIALAAMADSFIANANAAGIPMEVLHRVASMASGGMDTLPHNGAVITLLAVTGLSHRQSYKDIFAITLIKTTAVFVIIGVFYATGWV